MTLLTIFRAYKRCFNWSRSKPQSIGYGVLLFILGMTGIPDSLIQILGVIVSIGGLRASVDYLSNLRKLDNGL